MPSTINKFEVKTQNTDIDGTYVMDMRGSINQWFVFNNVENNYFMIGIKENQINGSDESNNIFCFLFTLVNPYKESINFENFDLKDYGNYIMTMPHSLWGTTSLPLAVFDLKERTYVGYAFPKRPSD